MPLSFPMALPILVSVRVAYLPVFLLSLVDSVSIPLLSAIKATLFWGLI